jgi:hypothetical protein
MSKFFVLSQQFFRLAENLENHQGGVRYFTKFGNYGKVLGGPSIFEKFGSAPLMYLSQVVRIRSRDVIFWPRRRRGQRNYVYLYL